MQKETRLGVAFEAPIEGRDTSCAASSKQGFEHWPDVVQQLLLRNGRRVHAVGLHHIRNAADSFEKERHIWQFWLFGEGIEGTGERRGVALAEMRWHAHAQQHPLSAG